MKSTSRRCRRPPSLWSSIVVVVIRRRRRVVCLSVRTSPISSSCHHVAALVCCHYRCVASSSPNVAEGEVVMWQWLAGVTMATGWVVAIRKEKEGGWWGLQCDALICTTVDGDGLDATLSSPCAVDMAGARLAGTAGDVALACCCRRGLCVPRCERLTTVVGSGGHRRCGEVAAGWGRRGRCGVHGGRLRCEVARRVVTVMGGGEGLYLCLVTSWTKNITVSEFQWT
jgi:hypothetical protein